MNYQKMLHEFLQIHLESNFNSEIFLTGWWFSVVGLLTNSISHEQPRILTDCTDPNPIGDSSQAGASPLQTAAYHLTLFLISLFNLI